MFRAGVSSVNIFLYSKESAVPLLTHTISNAQNAMVFVAVLQSVEACCFFSHGIKKIKEKVIAIARYKLKIAIRKSHKCET